MRNLIQVCALYYFLQLLAQVFIPHPLISIKGKGLEGRREDVFKAERGHEVSTTTPQQYFWLDAESS
jgi:hypothetical protein